MSRRPRKVKLKYWGRIRGKNKNRKRERWRRQFMSFPITPSKAFKEL